MAFSKVSFAILEDRRASICVLTFDYQGRQWNVQKRYSDFEKFFEKIQRQMSDEILTAPPKRRFFAVIDFRQWERRRNWLTTFIQELMNSPIFIKLLLVRQFFNFDMSNVSERNDSENDIEDKIDLGPSERSRATPCDFEFLKTVGKGSFGKVFLARHKMNRRVYAMKVVGKSHVKDRNEVKHIMSERNVLISNIQHPFLVSLHYSFQTKDKLYFVLDYLNGGEIFFHLQREKHFSENRARFYAAEISSALGYLHENNVIYRDLKPENLILDSQGHVILTDFGLCKEGITANDLTGTFCGTPEYLAPELIQKKQYDRTVDWWCLGSVLYEMLFGLPPFYSKYQKEMYEKIVNQPLHISHIVSASTRDILNCMLQKDREKRLGAKRDFFELKEHPFFLEIDWDKLLKRQLKPPFAPTVRGVLDTSNIDIEFTNMDVTGSHIPVNSFVDQSDRDFMGFTYVPHFEKL